MPWNAIPMPENVDKKGFICPACADFTTLQEIWLDVDSKRMRFECYCDNCKSAMTLTCPAKIEPKTQPSSKA